MPWSIIHFTPAPMLAGTRERAQMNNWLYRIAWRGSYLPKWKPKLAATVSEPPGRQADRQSFAWKCLMVSFQSIELDLSYSAGIQRSVSTIFFSMINLLIIRAARASKTRDDSACWTTGKARGRPRERDSILSSSCSRLSLSLSAVVVQWLGRSA